MIEKFAVVAKDAMFLGPGTLAMDYLPLHLLAVVVCI